MIPGELEKELNQLGPQIVMAGIEAVLANRLKEANEGVKLITHLRRWLKLRGVELEAWG
jgi:hypothetical protein